MLVGWMIGIDRWIVVVDDDDWSWMIEFDLVDSELELELVKS